jgi:ribosomal protein S18 acetylase RimI-like enzyme
MDVLVKDFAYTHSDAEFDELRGLCVTGYAASHKPFNWRLALLENWSYASRYLEPLEYFTSRVHLWRSGAGQLVGGLIRYYDLTYPQVLPGYRFVEDRMFDWAERNWAGGRAVIQTMVYDHDTERKMLLRQRGYEDRGTTEIVRIYDLSRTYPRPELPPGFRITTLAETGNYDERIALENSVWGVALDEAWFEGKSSAPHYSFDWDLLAVSPDGQQVAYCLVWLDTRNRMGEIDPMGTHPDYRGRGLARALVTESLRRMRAAGMRYAFIACEADDLAVNRLYSSLGPAETYLGNDWIKQLGAATAGNGSSGRQV